MDQNRARSTKLYQEDIVQLIDDPKSYGIVQRCWHDAEDVPPPHEHMMDPFMRPLKHGEVGVSFFPRGVHEILPESKLTLVDRIYQPGDLLKRSIDDVRSGIVTSIEVQGRLEHAISGEEIPGWKSTSDTESSIDVDLGDYVVYDHWVGQVVEMFDEALVEMTGGALVRLPEMSARLAVGERGPNILPPPVSGVHNLFGLLMGGQRPSSQDCVLSVRRTVLAVAWLAIDQSLSSAEAASRVRPQRFWYGEELANLTLVRRRAEQAMRVGDRVLLKDMEGLPVTYHGREGDRMEVRTLVVKETRTLVHVFWQDGTREILNAKDTIPYLNPDEYDCWPGDHVLWKNEDQKRPAIVQCVNAADRTAEIRFTDTGTVELASVLELDPHGSSDLSAASAHEGLGVHRGDFVFIHPEGTTNGLARPMVPRIGEVEEWVREAPTMEPSGHLGGWRREMMNVGNRIAEVRGTPTSVEEGKLRRPQKGDPRLNWFGEITDLRLDGTVEVMLPDATSTILPLERLTRLYDGLEQLEDMWEDDTDSHGSEAGDEEPAWTAMDAQGNWVEAPTDDADDWATDEEEDKMDVDEDERWSSSSPTALQPSEATPPILASMVIDVPHGYENGFSNTPSSSMGRPMSPDAPRDAIEIDELDKVGVDDGDETPSPWKRFEVLPSAPPDHAFYSSPPAQTSRTFLARLSKEYKVLQSSLPETILVRAYEDRTDLLRSLIIGPENTPYEDAPFVIDWMLDSNFPQSPPIAHFLSWTNGNGRVNPNLYEEGKVCLSILGTWAGDKNETWSAARSSLLQALVSIQGLVLVKEPWFCEPAYEKLRGTEEGIVNSRLYNEKAYVLSRGFVRRALEIPLGGLEEEIGWLYYTRGKLDKVVRDARDLILKSRTSAASGGASGEEREGEGGERERAVPRLTGGGMITLERTLVKLHGLLESSRRRAS